jgi:hypothetical protein
MDDAVLYRKDVVGVVVQSLALDEDIEAIEIVTVKEDFSRAVWGNAFCSGPCEGWREQTHESQCHAEFPDSILADQNAIPFVKALQAAKSIRWTDHFEILALCFPPAEEAAFFCCRA